jgi:hypothetical protein
MSAKRYFQALRHENPGEIPHQVWLDHPEFIRHATGVDFYDQPMTASQRFHERFDIDCGGPTFVEDHPLPRPEKNIRADGGVSGTEAFNTTWRLVSPFKEPEELWRFDPDPWGKDAEKSMHAEYAMQNFRWCFQKETWASRRQKADDEWGRLEKIWPGKFTDGRGFYCTTFMWGVCVFGWDVFLTALGLDPDRTGQTLQRMGDITAKIFDFYSTCKGCRFVAPHDDLCISTGPLADPKWYRRYIYPQYEKIFAPVRAAGQPVILTSDGNLTALALDIAPLVDGFSFESHTPRDFMFRNFGRDKCLIGGVDGKVLTFGTPTEVEQEVRTAIDQGMGCPGFIVACADTIPANVPIPNAYAYFDAVERYRRR